MSYELRVELALRAPNLKLVPFGVASLCGSRVPRDINKKQEL